MWQKLNVRNVITSVNESWLLNAGKLALDLNLEMLNGIGRDVLSKPKLATSPPTRLSITLNVFETVAATSVLICVSVACLLMQLMVAVWGIVKPKAFAKRSEPVQLLLTEVPQFDTKDENYKWMKDDFKV